MVVHGGRRPTPPATRVLHAADSMCARPGACYTRASWSGAVAHNPACRGAAPSGGRPGASRGRTSGERRALCVRLAQCGRGQAAVLVPLAPPSQCNIPAGLPTSTVTCGNKLEQVGAPPRDGAIITALHDAAAALLALWQSAAALTAIRLCVARQTWPLAAPPPPPPPPPPYVNTSSTP